MSCAAYLPVVTVEACDSAVTVSVNARMLLLRALASWRADAKGSDAPSPSRVVVDAEKLKPSVFLLVDITKGIWTIKLCTKPLVNFGNQLSQVYLENGCYYYYAPVPNRWGIKRCFCLTSDVCLLRTSGLS